MKKSISNLGTVLNRKELQQINGSFVASSSCASSCDTGCMNCVPNGDQPCGYGTMNRCWNGAKAGFNTCMICTDGIQ